MPVSFRPRVLRRAEVEKAVRSTEWVFSDVAVLVPDFSQMALGMDAESQKTAVLELGDEAGTRIVRQGTAGSDLVDLL